MLLLASLQMPAQTTMRDLWLALPDSVVPYLNGSQRTEHADFIDMGVASEVKNLLDGEGRMDTLTARYATIRLNDNHTLQMRLLTKSDSSQVVCLVDTYRAPEPESTISFYDTQWQRLDSSFGLPDLHALVSDAGQTERFFAQTDTLSQTEAAELRRLIDPVMVSVSLPEDEESVILQLSTPFLLQDEKERLKGVLMQTKFKWEGDLFKECK